MPDFISIDTRPTGTGSSRKINVTSTLLGSDLDNSIILVSVANVPVSTVITRAKFRIT